MIAKEIDNKIQSLKTDEEIEVFVDERLKELEEQYCEEKIVGQNYNDQFRDYISSSIHYKATDKFGNQDSADLVYDDKTPYINLIKTLKQTEAYDNYNLFLQIYNEVNKYLPPPKKGADFERMDKYFQKQVSIKDIKNSQCGMCSERSGLTQNLFKFMGRDIELIGGYRNDEPHAYSLLYPKGYDNNVAILIDTSHVLKFLDNEGNTKYNYPFYKVLKDDELIQFIENKTVNLDLTTTENEIKGYYPSLNSYQMKKEDITYTIGHDVVNERYRG